MHVAVPALAGVLAGVIWAMYLVRRLPPGGRSPYVTNKAVDEADYVVGSLQLALIPLVGLIGEAVSYAYFQAIPPTVGYSGAALAGSVVLADWNTLHVRSNSALMALLFGGLFFSLSIIALVLFGGWVYFTFVLASVFAALATSTTATEADARPRQRNRFGEAVVTTVLLVCFVSAMTIIYSRWL